MRTTKARRPAGNGTVLALIAACCGVALVAAVRPALAQNERWSFPQVLDPRADARTMEGRPGLARDRAGSLHAVWLAMPAEGAATEIAYARRAPGGAWSPPERAAAPDGIVRDAPDVAVSSRGDVHVVWVEQRGLTTFIAHRLRERSSGLWSAVDHVDPVFAPIGQGEPRVATDLWGNVHVVWTDHRGGTADVYHSRRAPDGAWSPGAPICNPVAGDQRAPSLAATSGGDLHAAWEDTRDGRVRIYASRLPAGGMVWWPNAALSQDDVGRPQRGPSVAANGAGLIHAAWIDPLEATIRTASLSPDEPYWGADRIIHTATRGPLRDVAMAGGPGPLAILTWGEGREQGARVYAAALDALAAGQPPERVDGAPQFGDGRFPVVAVGSDAVAHVLWTSQPQSGNRTVVHGDRRYPEPERRYVAGVAGAIAYVPLRLNCHRDGYVLRDCEGAVVHFIADETVDLAPFLGNWVSVDGAITEDDGCARLAVGAVRLATSPCPNARAGVTGHVTANGRPGDAALVQVGASRALAGPSGRFYVGDLPPGTYAVTATVRCALPARIEGLSLGPRQLVQLPAARVVRGDVNMDCRIDLRDLVAIAARYRHPADAAQPCLDLDGDGTVALGDLVQVASQFGRACPQPWLPTPMPTAFAAVAGSTPAAESANGR